MEERSEARRPVREGEPPSKRTKIEDAAPTLEPSLSDPTVCKTATSTASLELLKFVELRVAQLEATLLESNTNCFYIFCGHQSLLKYPELKGVELMFYNQIFVLDGHNAALEELIVKAIPEKYPIISKQRTYSQGRFGYETRVIRGEVPKVHTVTENGLKFKVHLLDKLDTGFYPDMCKARKWVMENAERKKMVNFFAYTCGFGAAAKKGKCLSMDNVDSSRTALQSGKENYQLNGISFHPREFENFTTKEYCRQFCKRARKLEQQNERRRNAQNMNNDGTEQTTPQPQRKDKQQKKFDIAIIDPSPPKKSDDMKLPEQRLQYYVVNFNYVVPIIEDGGIILQCCHCKDLPDEIFIDFFCNKVNLANKKVEFVEKIGYPDWMDIPDKGKMFAFKLSDLPK